MTVLIIIIALIGLYIYFVYIPKKKIERREKGRLRALKLFNNGEYDKVIKMLGETKLIDWEEARALGLSLFHVGEKEKGIDQLKEGLNFTDFFYSLDKIRISLAQCYFEMEDWEASINFLQEVSEDTIADNRKDKEFHLINMTGVCFMKMENYDLAMESFKMAPLTSKTPNKELLDIINNMGVCYEEKGDKKNAVKMYNRVLANRYSKEFADKVKELTIL